MEICLLERIFLLFSRSTHTHSLRGFKYLSKQTDVDWGWKPDDHDDNITSETEKKKKPKKKLKWWMPFIYSFCASYERATSIDKNRSFSHFFPLIFN